MDPGVIAMMIDLRMATADTLADDVSAGTLAILLITRPEIERGSVGDVVDRLMAMTDSASTTSNLAGSVIVQVDGYNDDPRELSEIKEVREFFLAIDAQWSYWAHFLNTSLTDAFNLLISLLLRPKRQFLNGNAIDNEYDPVEVEAFLVNKIGAVYQLHRMHGLPVAGLRGRMDQLLRSVFGPRASAEALSRILDAAAAVEQPRTGPLSPS